MGLDLITLLREDNRVDEFTMKMCRSGETELTRKMMSEKIQSVLVKMESGSITDIRKTVVPKAADQKPKLQKKGPVDRNKLPPDLCVLDDRIKEMYSQNKVMKGQLRQIIYNAAGEPRSQKYLSRYKADVSSLAFSVANNQKEIQASWKRIDYYLLHGHYMPGTEPNTERRMVAVWLDEQPQMINYIRQADSYFKQNQKYRDKELYDRYKGELEKIKKYVEDWL